MTRTDTLFPYTSLFRSLLLWSVSGGAGDRSQIGIAAWAATMFGALVPAVYAMQSGPDNWFAQWRFMLGFGGAYVAVLIPFLMWLAAWTASVPTPPGAMPVPGYQIGSALCRERMCQ